MKISGNSGAAHAAQIDRIKTNPKQSETVEQTQANETEAAASESLGQDSSEKQKGVIRNLLDGHYKGVADLRLRINFHDELAALEEGVKISSLQGNLPDFSSSLDEAFSGLLENQDMDEQQLLQINNEKNSLDLKLENILRQGLSSTELFSSVQNETNTFLETIHSLFEPAANEIVEQEAPAEPLTQVADNPLTNFRDLVADALGSLEEGGLSIKVLPELSEPSGNGAAYEKFLAIYQDLQNSGSIMQAEQEQPTVQTEA